MKFVVLVISLLFVNLALAKPRPVQPEVKDSMELFNKIQPEIKEELKSASVAQGRIWSLNKIMQKYKPEDLQQALLDISLESAPQKSQKMKVYKVVAVAPGSIYDQAGVKPGDYAAQ